MTIDDHAPVEPVQNNQPRSVRLVYIVAGICIALFAVGTKGLQFYDHYVDVSRIVTLRDDIATLKKEEAIDSEQLSSSIRNDDHATNEITAALDRINRDLIAKNKELDRLTDAVRVQP